MDDVQVVVRNSRKGDKWENEEKEGKQPFVPLIDFDIVIMNEPYSLQVCARLSVIV
jgi:hypothetical protein